MLRRKDLPRRQQRVWRLWIRCSYSSLMWIKHISRGYNLRSSRYVCSRHSRDHNNKRWLTRQSVKSNKRKRVMISPLCKVYIRIHKTTAKFQIRATLVPTKSSTIQIFMTNKVISIWLKTNLPLQRSLLLKIFLISASPSKQLSSKIKNNSFFRSFSFYHTIFTFFSLNCF